MEGQKRQWATNWSSQEKDWLLKQQTKDEKELEISKKRMIEEVKSLNKDEMFKPQPKRKISIIDKLKKLFDG